MPVSPWLIALTSICRLNMCSGCSMFWDSYITFLKTSCDSPTVHRLHTSLSYRRSVAQSHILASVRPQLASLLLPCILRWYLGNRTPGPVFHEHDASYVRKLKNPPSEPSSYTRGLCCPTTSHPYVLYSATSLWTVRLAQHSSVAIPPSGTVCFISPWWIECLR